MIISLPTSVAWIDFLIVENSLQKKETGTYTSVTLVSLAFITQMNVITFVGLLVSSETHPF